MKELNKRTLAPAIVGGVLLTVMLIMFSPLFYITQVDIVGNESMTEGAIRNKLNLNTPMNIFVFNEGKSEELLKENKYIETVRFTKLYPGKLRIAIQERRLCGYVQYMQDTYLYIDENGRVLEISPTRNKKLPIIVGLEFDSFSVGEILNTKNQTSFKALVSINSLLRKYDPNGELVSRIDISNNRDIHLYAYNVDIMLGDIKDVEEKIRAMIEILNNLPDINQAGTLDMREAGKQYSFKILT